MMESNIAVRRAIVTDIASITEILTELGWFAPINESSEKVTKERLRKHLAQCQADDSHTVLVAEDKHAHVLGYISVHWLPYMILAAPEGYVSELFVREASRGMGVGSKLLEAVKQEAVGRGCARLMLVNNRNRPSYVNGFYQKHGWEERPDMANFILRLS